MRRLMNIGFFLPTLTKGHSWIDAFFRDDKWPAANEDKLAKIVYGGSSAGGPDYASGFPRNYPTRGYPNINTGYSCKHLDGGTSNVCCNLEDYYGPGGIDQSVFPTSASLPILQANPGETVHFVYSPNGHVAKDVNARGTPMYIIWTKVRESEFTEPLSHYLDDLKSYSVVTNGTVNDYGLNFDDGICGETCKVGYGADCPGEESDRAGDGVPCHSSFTVPEGHGMNTMAWVWDYRNPTNSLYTTCFDIEIGDVSALPPSLGCTSYYNFPRPKCS